MKNNTGLACLGLIALLFLATGMNSILSGYVLSVLWGWFIVPFFGAPKLSIALAIGISLVVGMLTHQSTNSDSKNKEWSEVIAEIIVQSVALPLAILFFGYVVHLFL